MTPRDDRFPDMGSGTHIDAAIERVLRGDAVGDDVAPFAEFVDDMLVMADRPPPPPSLELAALLAGSASSGNRPASVTSLPPRARSNLRAQPTRPSSRRSRTSEMRRRAVAVGVGGKAAALLLALATTAVAGAAAGILPEPAAHLLRRAVEVVTPFDMPDDAAAGPGRSADAVRGTEAATGDELPDASVTGVRTQPTGVGADEGARPVPNPTDGMSSWAGTYAKTRISAGQAGAATPASSPPKAIDPAKAPAPHAGPATKPAPKASHVPPGHSPSGTPHDDESDSGGAPLMNHGASQDRPHPPAPKGPPPGGGPPQGAPSRPTDDGSHHERLPGSEPGPGSSGEAPPSAQHRPPPYGPSPGGGSDRDQCGQPSPSGPPPAGCGRGDPQRDGSPDAGGEGLHHAGPAAATGEPGP